MTVATVTLAAGDYRLSPPLPPDKKPEPLRWAPSGSPNMHPMGAESKGTVTYTCRAKVANQLWLGRTWPGAGCFIGIDGRREYAAPGNYEVLVGESGRWATTHHGGVLPNALVGDDRLVVCVAIRATGELVPGWLAPPSTKDRFDCYYEWNGGDAHESHYRLLIVDDHDQVQKHTGDIAAACNGGICQAADDLGRWVAQNAPQIIAVISAVAAAYLCAELGGTVGAAGGPAGAGAGAGAGVVMCTIPL